MSTLEREHAEVLAIAIERGIASPQEEIDWACQLVVAQTNRFARLLQLEPDTLGGRGRSRLAPPRSGLIPAILADGS